MQLSIKERIKSKKKNEKIDFLGDRAESSVPCLANSRAVYT